METAAVKLGCQIVVGNARCWVISEPFEDADHETWVKVVAPLADNALIRGCSGVVAIPVSAIQSVMEE